MVTVRTAFVMSIGSSGMGVPTRGTVCLFLIVASLTHNPHTAFCFPGRVQSCYLLAFEACHRSCPYLVISISQQAKRVTTLEL